MTFVSASLNAGAVPCHQFQDERLRNVEPWSRQCSLSPPLGTKAHQVQLPSRNNDRLHHVGARGTNAAEHLAHLPPPRRSAHNGQSHSPATMKLLRRLGLTYVATEELTIRRLRHGRGFRYVAADGTPLRGEESQRLAALAPSILRLGPGLSFRRRRCPRSVRAAQRWHLDG